MSNPPYSLRPLAPSQPLSQPAIHTNTGQHIRSQDMTEHPARSQKLSSPGSTSLLPQPSSVQPHQNPTVPNSSGSGKQNKNQDFLLDVLKKAQDRVDERNRKGRERSLRTRRRNAARLRNLEANCMFLRKENEILKEIRALLDDSMFPQVHQKVDELEQLYEKQSLCHVCCFDARSRTTIQSLASFTSPNFSAAQNLPLGNELVPFGPRHTTGAASNMEGIPQLTGPSSTGNTLGSNQIDRSLDVSFTSEPKEMVPASNLQTSPAKEKLDIEGAHPRLDLNDIDELFMGTNGDLDLC